MTTPLAELVHQRFGSGFRAAFWTPLASVGRFRERAGTGESPSEDYVVNVLFDGAYLARGRRGLELVDANQWVFYERDEPSWTQPVTRGPRSGAYLRYHPRLLRQILGELAPREAEAERPRFQVKTAGVQTHLLAQLHGLLAHPHADGVEEALLLLAHDLVAATCPTAPAKLSARRTDAVREVQQTLTVELSQTQALAELGERVDLSPYHLARGFRAHTGLSIHAYRERLRLHRAAGRLATRPDLTELALELGYSSHSHFTARFRRYFGVPPSAFA